MKKILPLLILICAIFGFALHKYREGFYPFRVTCRASCAPFLTTSEISPETAGILDQPFTYLGRGRTCFAFVSQDGKYVLKLINDRYQRMLNLCNSFPYFNPLLRTKIAFWKDKRAAHLRSYKIAYDSLKEETGLLGYNSPDTPAHHLPKEILLIDKIGKKWQIDPQNVLFFVQKKADLFFPYLTDLKTNHCDKELKEQVAAFRGILEHCDRINIFNKDPELGRNFGFVDGKPIIIDIGAFYPTEEAQEMIKKLYKKKEKLEAELLQFEN